MAVVAFLLLFVASAAYAIDKQLEVSANLRAAVDAPVSTAHHAPEPLAILQVSGSVVLSI